MLNFSYDAQGRLVRVTRDGVIETRYYDGAQVFIRTTGGNIIDWNIWGPIPDELLARHHTASGSWHYFHQDQIQNVFAVTDATGAVLERYLYDPFGEPDIRTASWSPLSVTAINNSTLFTGQEWIEELRLSNYKNRFYQPKLGRFLQNDPIRFDGGDMNLYRYVFNDPYNHTDPDGQIAFLVPVGIYLGKMAIDYAIERGIEHAKEKHLTAEQRVWADRAQSAHTAYKLASGNARQIYRSVSDLGATAQTVNRRGRKGSPEVRTQNQQIGERNEATGKGTHTGGGDLPETHFPPPGGGTKGGRFGDVTNTDASGKRHITQTVDTLANGEPTSREIEAAIDIYERLNPGETLTLTPKGR